MSYTEVQVEINPFCEDFISEFLISELGFGGVILEEKIYKKITSSDDLPNANEACFDEKNSSHIIKAYAQNLEISEKELQQKIFDKKQSLLDFGMELQNLGSWNAKILQVEDESWSENWKKYWDVQKIGQRTVICPSWLECSSANEDVVLEIDPGAAFGTGTHQTTRLCICELEKMVEPDCTIADIGCGSGILSVASKKYGAGNIIGVDVDETSIDVAKDNAKKNDVKCDFYQGSAKDVDGKFDIVVANILAHIIIEIMPDLVPLMKANGRMLLSGIIEEKQDAMKKILAEHNLEVEKVTKEDEWVCMVAKKKTF